MGFDKDICAGAISALSEFNTPLNSGYFKTYGLAALLRFIPVLIYTHLRITESKRFYVGLFFCVLATLPLYVVAIDWGRWLSATGILTLLTLLQLHKKQRPLTTKKPYLIFIYAASFFYLFNWKLPHCCVEQDRFVQTNNIKWWASSFLPPR